MSCYYSHNFIVHSNFFAIFITCICYIFDKLKYLASNQLLLKELADRHGVTYHETSAKLEDSAINNVDFAFMSLVKKSLSREKSQVGRVVGLVC